MAHAGAIVDLHEPEMVRGVEKHIEAIDAHGTVFPLYFIRGRGDGHLNDFFKLWYYLVLPEASFEVL